MGYLIMDLHAMNLSRAVIIAKVKVNRKILGKSGYSYGILELKIIWMIIITTKILTENKFIVLVSF